MRGCPDAKFHSLFKGYRLCRRPPLFCSVEFGSFSLFLIPLNCVLPCCCGFVAFRRFMSFLHFWFSISPRLVDSAFLCFFCILFSIPFFYVFFCVSLLPCVRVCVCVVFPRYCIFLCFCDSMFLCSLCFSVSVCVFVWWFCVVAFCLFFSSFPVFMVFVVLWLCGLRVVALWVCGFRGFVTLCFLALWLCGCVALWLHGSAVLRWLCSLVVLCFFWALWLYGLVALWL